MEEQKKNTISKVVLNQEEEKMAEAEKNKQ